MSQVVIVKSDEAKKLHLKLGVAIDEVEELEAKLQDAITAKNEASAIYWALVDEAVKDGGSEHFDIREESDESE